MAHLILFVCLLSFLIWFVWGTNHNCNKELKKDMERESRLFEAQWKTLTSKTRQKMKEHLKGDCGCENIMRCNFRQGCWHLKSEIKKDDWPWPSNDFHSSSPTSK